jgi:hypothetical protein
MGRIKNGEVGIRCTFSKRIRKKTELHRIFLSVGKPSSNYEWGYWVMELLMGITSSFVCSMPNYERIRTYERDHLCIGVIISFPFNFKPSTFNFQPSSFIELRMGTNNTNYEWGYWAMGVLMGLTSSFVCSTFVCSMPNYERIRTYERDHLCIGVIISFPFNFQLSTFNFQLSSNYEWGYWAMGVLMGLTSSFVCSTFVCSMPNYERIRTYERDHLCIGVIISFPFNLQL